MVLVIVFSFMGAVVLAVISYAICFKVGKVKDEAEKIKRATELRKKVDKIQIVERVDKEGNNYYIAEISFAFYNHLRWKPYLYNEEEVKEGLNNWTRTIIETPIRFDTFEEAQEKSIEKADRLRREERAESYRKVIGEFEA